MYDIIVNDYTNNNYNANNYNNYVTHKNSNNNYNIITL